MSHISRPITRGLPRLGCTPRDPARPGVSLEQFAGHPAYGTQQLCNDPGAVHLPARRQRRQAPRSARPASHEQDNIVNQPVPHRSIATACNVGGNPATTPLMSFSSIT